MSTTQEIFWYRFEPEPVGENINRIKALQNDKIWISDPNNFNDPLDLRLKIKSGNDWDNNEKLYLSVLEGFLKNESPNLDSPLLPSSTDIAQIFDDLIPSQYLVRLMNQRISTFGIQCFSRHWNSVLSWAHYSDGYRGYSIKYLAKEWTIATDNRGTCHFDNVIYVNQLPEISLAECIFAPHETLKRVLATKHADWAYESEVRIVHYKAKGQVTQMPNGLTISSLIVGAIATEETERLILNKALELNVKVEYASFVNGALQLTDKATWHKLKRSN
ncbi:DUF2971 domain-containing protein [Rheinheimera soli]|uniref:DUF2971 domain-containing protein n=1 Tax=Rheinheimera soli TaxID=443616 RepID=A0ABU1VZP8_9GAMM|nr:DUF2971 domain-containing protein [Rheinheimera soli]MDR7121184.1 hypothetical protein [Rheinheimera soli]